MPGSAKAWQDPLITGQRSFTYGELDHLSDAVAMGLIKHGLTPGDVVSQPDTQRGEIAVAYVVPAA